MVVSQPMDNQAVVPHLVVSALTEMDKLFATLPQGDVKILV